MRDNEYNAHKGLQDTTPSGWTPRARPAEPVARPAAPLAFIMRIVTIITLIVLAFHFGMMYAGSL